MEWDNGRAANVFADEKPGVLGMLTRSKFQERQKYGGRWQNLF